MVALYCILLSCTCQHDDWTVGGSGQRQTGIFPGRLEERGDAYHATSFQVKEINLLHYITLHCIKHMDWTKLLYELNRIECRGLLRLHYLCLFEGN